MAKKYDIRYPGSRRRLLPVELVDRHLHLVLALQEICIPGSTRTGAMIRDLATRIAGRIGISIAYLYDLQLVAQLFNIGRIVTRIEDCDQDPREENWRSAVRAAVLFRRVPGMASAAEIIGSVYENWDGSGNPDHLQRGQIPLRSRILRVAIDYLESSSLPGKSHEDALAELEEYSGTRYDPMALSHLLQVTLPQSEVKLRDPRHRLIPIDTLETGMVIAQDLYTRSGVKLLSRGSVVTANAKEMIFRRHLVDPIIGGVLVRRTEDPIPARDPSDPESEET